jgi:ATPase subunit of ABC transporter with duplicated ATPase domains
MDFVYSIPLIGGGTKGLTLSSGSSAVFVGANGSGKSRLGSYLELKTQHTDKTHRVGAQRALQIPSHIPMADPTKAQHALRYGHDTSKNKEKPEMAKEAYHAPSK